MGHVRLGPIPKTRKWNTVVAMFSQELSSEGVAARLLSTEDVGRIATATLEAAETGLARAVDDRGLHFTFYLLTQLVLSAREDDWQRGLRPFGITLGPDASVFDLTTEIQAAIDNYLQSSETRSRTDVGEIAQRAAMASLSSLVAPRIPTLFGNDRDGLQTVVRQLGTKRGFAELSQQFFGRFLAHYLNFYLSRITATQVNSGPLRQLGDITRFNDSLYAHCHQSAKIVRDFSGEWYSSTEYREGINLANTAAFMAVAVKKLQAELKQQEAEA